jgi:hypothetical protein
MKITKVKEPLCQEVYECPRCCQNYCNQCCDSVIVDFDIKELERVGMSSKMINWKDYHLCPWCYNQLVDISVSKHNGDSNGN